MLFIVSCAFCSASESQKVRQILRQTRFLVCPASKISEFRTSITRGDLKVDRSLMLVEAPRDESLHQRYSSKCLWSLDSHLEVLGSRSSKDEDLGSFGVVGG